MDKPGQVALIADPDEFLRLALGILLTSRLGFSSVVEAASLEQAFESLATEDQISLALFELTLPDVTSAASFATVRQCFPKLRTVVVSNSDRRQNVLAALEAGVHGFISKQMTPDELTSALDSILRGQIYVPASISTLTSQQEETQESHGRTWETSSVGDLTPRQKEVLELLVQGKTNKEIAKTLKLGEGTVKVHLAALFRAFGVTSRAAVAVAGAQMKGYVTTHSNARVDKPFLPIRYHDRPHS